MSKMYRVVALSLVLAACTDDPLSVTTDDPELPGNVEEVVTAVGRSHSPGGGGGPIAESFRHRLSVNVEIDGDMVPHETTTVRLEGVANEKVAGGEVKVLLPTMVAMDHAGTDKHPNYPTGKTIPPAANWALPTMDAGETWKRSVEVTLPDKGYYQVGVTVDAQAPDAKVDPFLLDTANISRWLLVMDGGGLVTIDLDPSVMPDGVIPMEGPFRESRRGRGTGSSAAPTNNDGEEGYITLHLVYWHDDELHDAVGAEVKVKYMDQLDELLYTVTLESDANGEVRFECPSSYEWVDGSAYTPNTDDIKGRYWITGFEYYSSDCGDDVHQSRVSAFLFMPWMHLNESVPAMEDYFDTDRAAVVWALNRVDSLGTFYWRDGDSITVDYKYFDHAWVAAHEFGHALHHVGLGGIANTDDCAGHEIRIASSYQCAFSEGFADFAASAALGYPHQWESSMDTVRTEGRDDAEIEGRVAALFLDLIDSDNQGEDDDTNYPADYIADVFSTCYINGQVDRVNVTDFVWCLENRVHADVHGDAFPLGPDAPSSARERATEPDDWDQDDIREVWIRNVGGGTGG